MMPSLTQQRHECKKYRLLMRAGVFGLHSTVVALNHTHDKLQQYSTSEPSTVLSL
jgi:hypothetical protein